MELLIRLKFFWLKLSSNLVKIIAHQFPGQKNCLQILNSCHYSPCQLEGQQKAPSKNGQSQEQPFTSHYSYSSSWESEDERKLCNQLATLCFFLFGWMQVVVWERWPVSLIGWGARCVSQELKLPPKHRVLCPRANRIWQSYCDMKLKIRYIYMEVLAFSQKDKMLTSRLFPGRDCRHLLWLLVFTTLLLLVNLLRLRSKSFVKSSNTL